MPHVNRFFIIGPFILLIIMNCVVRSPKTVAVTERNAGSTVALNKGDTLQVVLVGNPSTGYIWQTQTFDKKVIARAGELKFKPDRDEPGFVGSPGKMTLCFEAVGEGQTDLALFYSRPWDTNTPPAQTIRMTVAVKLISNNGH